nr:hypothetical protein [Bacteroidota bacterium]
MRRFNLISALLGLAIAAMLMTSCKKDDEAVIQDTDTTTSQYDALAEGIFNDVGNIADEAYDLGSSAFKSSEGDKYYLGDCATVTLDTIVFPHELIIDFGEVNCLCNDGRYRRGKIIVTFTGRYIEPGTVITHGFENYYVNDNKVEGSRVATNHGFNGNGNMYFTVEVVGLITFADESENSGTISWNAFKAREWIEGYGTRPRWDDVYLITGSASGVGPAGYSWAREIIIPLRREIGCRYFVSGSVEITPENRPVRLLDYGDGECDNIATVTIDGKTHTIYLR